MNRRRFFTRLVGASVALTTAARLSLEHDRPLEIGYFRGYLNRVPSEGSHGYVIRHVDCPCDGESRWINEDYTTYPQSHEDTF